MTILTLKRPFLATPKRRNRHFQDNKIILEHTFPMKKPNSDILIEEGLKIVRNVQFVSITMFLANQTSRGTRLLIRDSKIAKNQSPKISGRSSFPRIYQLGRLTPLRRTIGGSNSSFRCIIYAFALLTERHFQYIAEGPGDCTSWR